MWLVWNLQHPGEEETVQMYVSPRQFSFVRRQVIVKRHFDILPDQPQVYWYISFAISIAFISVSVNVLFIRNLQHKYILSALVVNANLLPTMYKLLY